MKILRTCVIDDEPLAARLIENYVTKTPFLQLVGVFESAQEAVRTVIEGEIDLVFLDINMPQLNGLEFARILPRRCKVVFTTAYDNFALQGFRVNALDYLLKPINYEEFFNAASKALTALSGGSEDISATGSEFIIVKSEYKLQQIPVRDILFIEGVKDYVKIYLDGETKAVMTLMNMRTLEQELPSRMFMRVHRSFIVNTSKIRVIERKRIVFDNTYIPVSDSYSKEFNDFINSRLVGGNRTQAASSQTSDNAL